MSEESAATQEDMPAALLVHGFNGEPLDMVELEEHLQWLGLATRNLLLPGHGSSARDLAHTTWADWSHAVASAADEMLERHSRVVLVGHSMGGALALHVAANNPRISGVAALCPPLHMRPGQIEMAAACYRIVPFLPTLWEDVRDRGVRLRYRRRVYRWTPIAAAHSLFTALPRLRDELPEVRCPALVLCARRDHVVPPRDGMETFRLLGTEDKELHVLERSYHVVTKDVERHIVFHRVGAFALRATAATSAAGAQRRGA
jgi:carboxylesterase